MKKADTIVIGSPLYWHNICGSVRNVLDRFYGLVSESELQGRAMYFLFQGAAPEKWMLEAGEYTICLLYTSMLILMLGSMISGILLSNHIFKAVTIAGTTIAARQVHMFCAYW